MNFSQLNFGLFSLRFYGILLAIAFVMAAWSYYRNLQKAAFPIDFFVHHFWYWILGGIFIGRIGALLFHFDIFVASPLFSFFAFWEGGINIYGFIIGFVLFMWKETHDHQFNFWRWIEHSIQPIFILILFHDATSLFTGHLYGIETTLPWGIQYETFGVETIKPVHPVGGYAFIIHSILYIWWHYSLRKQTYSGLSAVKIILLSLLVIDFLLSFLTANTTGHVFNILAYEQILALCLAALLAKSLWREPKKS
jgi:prolipoprotein diacylglyceryltransferase